MRTASIFSPRRSTMKLSGSLRAGCWGPIGTVTTLSLSLIDRGSFLKCRFGFRFPILQKRVIPFRPILWKRVADTRAQAVNAGAKQVHELALIDISPREVRGDRLYRPVLGAAGFQVGHDAAVFRKVIDESEVCAKVQPGDGAQDGESHAFHQVIEHGGKQFPVRLDPQTGCPLHFERALRKGEPGLELRGNRLNVTHFFSSRLLMSLTKPSMMACGLAGQPGM